MLFSDKYRIESARFQKWDYSTPGWYFVTICTYNRQMLLSSFIDHQVVLKPAGIITNEEWIKTGKLRPNVFIDEFVIMPNHIHGIIRIKPDGGTIANVDGGSHVDTPCNGFSPVETPWYGVSNSNETAYNAASKNAMPWDDIKNETPCHGVQTETPYHGVSTEGGTQKNHNSPQNWGPGVLGAIIGQFKIVVTKRVRQNGIQGFGWQSRFHDHIIRNEKELYFIRRYIRENPLNWEKSRDKPDRN